MHRTRYFLALVHFFLSLASLIDSAPSDSPRDADIAQSGYVGGDHNIGPESLSRFQHLWNFTFKPDEKHYARPLVHTLASGKQIVFTASTENVVRTIDATTGEIMYERQVAPPWPMAGAYCETVSKNLGIMGTPVIYPEYDVAFFFVKSYIDARDYRVPGGANPPLNSVYYFYAVYLDGLGDVYKFPLFIDDVPADNDERKLFLGGLVLQRPSLLSVGDVVYAGFGGLCDAFNYTGTLVAININTRTINRWVTQGGPTSPWTSNWTKWHGGGAGGIWQSGMGLASDGHDVFFSIDNGGTTDTNASSIPVQGKSHQDILSESIARVSLNDSGVQLLDFFRPADYLSDAGQDIGSGGVSILDPMTFNTSAVPHIGVSTGRNAKVYVQNLDELGGYRTGANGTDTVLQTIHLRGEVFGGIGSYPLEGGYIYVNPGNASLVAYRFSASAGNGSTELFALAGTAETENTHWGGGGIPTVTSKNGDPGSGIVWVTDVQRGLLAYKAVPVDGKLVELALPKVDGAVRFGRPIFGDGKVYLFDGKGRLIALGASGNITAAA
ncbi:uncharacterized protein CC84DRAFT_1188072 [Paraphaeosphaeria sporulosa]|uniref:Pyrrolo-quinoline quinone n=1 Tax=Paraphaeosphaeria sporulosa TaxID=1460663 RepID=A0A177CDJ0_9PLEO|nr:uncharacterized protein CC84DRAFT_1188072 [Paraphaeosphaeria sporulosa]OAG05301.1 hypothetical protein CC84DRAFT_1188072 [Paraphaeosphaeria sporulosa]